MSMLNFDELKKKEMLTLTFAYYLELYFHLEKIVCTVGNVFQLTLLITCSVQPFSLEFERQYECLEYGVRRTKAIETIHSLQILI